MVLAMFVDAGRADLLGALAGGRVFVTPTVLDPDETPPFAQQPTAEFAKGTFYFQQRLGLPVDAVRHHRRVAFYSARGNAWRPIELSTDELGMTAHLLNPSTWEQAAQIAPSVRVKRIDRGEAECAAVALTRKWTLWSDDAAIVALLSALHPDHPFERINDLLARGVRENLIGCNAASELYNDVFKGQLKLWTRLVLGCENGELVVQ
ncbi:MAG TPA: hypothetical protein VGF59_01625 [Bryobacteraceae bacterium]|jgi:hypothetical protein